MQYSTVQYSTVQCSTVQCSAVQDVHRMECSGTRYLDTMSLHIATAGMTSQQRLVWQAAKNCTEEELKHKPR